MTADLGPQAEIGGAALGPCARRRRGSFGFSVSASGPTAHSEHRRCARQLQMPASGLPKPAIAIAVAGSQGRLPIAVLRIRHVQLDRSSKPAHLPLSRSRIARALASCTSKYAAIWA